MNYLGQAAPATNARLILRSISRIGCVSGTMYFADVKRLGEARCLSNFPSMPSGFFNHSHIRIYLLSHYYPGLRRQ